MSVLCSETSKFDVCYAVDSCDQMTRLCSNICFSSRTETSANEREIRAAIFHFVDFLLSSRKNLSATLQKQWIIALTFLFSLTLCCSHMVSVPFSGSYNYHLVVCFFFLFFSELSSFGRGDNGDGLRLSAAGLRTPANKEEKGRQGGRQIHLRRRAWKFSKNHFTWKNEKAGINKHFGKFLVSSPCNPCKM